MKKRGGKQNKKRVTVKRNTPHVKRRVKRRVVARKGGLVLHRIGGSLKGFRKVQNHKLCGHPRRHR